MHPTITILPDSVTTAELHHLLLTAIAPRPIAFASTVNAAGQVNLSPFSFFNVFGANPPIVIFSPARRVRDNTIKHTLENVSDIPEVVINIVNYAIVEQMSLSSTEYAQGVNEFTKAGLTQIPSTQIRPPRVGEAPVAMECVVEQVIETGQEGGAGNLVIARVVAIHIRPEYMDENGKLDTRKLDLVARMGGDWYCRANGDALFEIPKPLQTMGIGIDQLPEHIRHSSILTGNNLGRLGNLSGLPDAAAIEAYATEHKEWVTLLRSMDRAERMEQVHHYGKALIEKGDAKAALIALCLFEQA